MNIEEEIFGKYSVSRDKLAAYGFKPDGDRLIYTRELPGENFGITVEYSDSFSGRITDLDTGEEYINYRLEAPTGFSAEIRDKYTGLLSDIRDKCCVNLHYESAQARRLIASIAQVYGDSPEFLWKRFPDFAAVRKKKNGKWYALFGRVARSKIAKASPDDSKAEVINLKTADAGLFVAKEGYYPAYHMNKKNWISIILDDTLSDDEIAERIGESYNLV